MTKDKPFVCVVLAAGRGSRMCSNRPKVLHSLAGRALLGWVLEAVSVLEPQRIIVVTGPGMESVATYAAPHKVALQPVQDGTGGALAAALTALQDFCGRVLVVMGDVPLIESATLHGLLHAATEEEIAVLGAQMDDPTGYGRIVQNDAGTVLKIVEEKDATLAQKTIHLVNAGAWVFPMKNLNRWLSMISTDNAAQERYVTDLPAIAAQEGIATKVHIATDAHVMAGVNTKADLAALEGLVQTRLRTKAMAQGVTLVDPSTTYFSWDTHLARDVEVGPCVVFGPDVIIETGAQIKAFSHLEGVRVESHAIIGPFARVRPGSHIGSHARVGNFVEIKASHLGSGAKAGHLAYIGDATLGADVNFSAGAVVANYDGRKKHKTIIGDGAMVGTNATLVAPVEVGAGAFIAAGSVITKDVEGGALSIARCRQETKPRRAPKQKHD